MFKLPNPPDDEAKPDELADFAEILAWRQGTTSAREVIDYLRQRGDSAHNRGANDDDDDYAASVDEAMNEIDRRKKACGAGYPFDLTRRGAVLQFEADDDDHRSIIYRFLLLATRLNMTSTSRHAGLNGTHLFEEICAYILRCYLGRSRARAMVFGTSAGGGFAAKVNLMCEGIGEKNRYNNNFNLPEDANDDKLDAVAWVPFSDKTPSQLIIFGQCKTGTSWEGLVTQLQPDNFVSLWVHPAFLLTPVRAFCITDSEDRAKWSHRAIYAGLFFDRCRVVDYCEDFDPGSDVETADLFRRIQQWTAAAYATISL